MSLVLKVLRDDLVSVVNLVSPELKDQRVTEVNQAPRGLKDIPD